MKIFSVLFTSALIAVLGACNTQVASTNNSSTTTNPSSNSSSNVPQFYQDSYATQVTYYTNYNSGSCGFGAQANTNVTAINASLYNNAALCGAYIEVTGNQGTVTLKVVDDCPASGYCVNNHLDMSDTAYHAVTTEQEPANVNWKFVEAPIGSNTIKLYWAATVTPYFMDVVVDEIRHPVASVEIKDSSGAYITGVRTTSNHFQFSPGGSNTFLSPFDIRLTDMFGNKVQDTVSWSANTTTTTVVQFPAY